MQGNQQIIDTLNSLLAGELTAVDQYLIHGEMYAASAAPPARSDIARALIQRILFLEGKPDLSKREALNVGKTVEQMLEADLAVEYHVVKTLTAAIAQCEAAQDYVTRDMLRIQLDDTEMDHAYFLEKQLRLIKLTGLQNYLQSQMGSAPSDSNA